MMLSNFSAGSLPFVTSRIKSARDSAIGVFAETLIVDMMPVPIGVNCSSNYERDCCRFNGLPTMKILVFAGRMFLMSKLFAFEFRRDVIVVARKHESPIESKSERLLILSCLFA